MALRLNGNGPNGPQSSQQIVSQNSRAAHNTFFQRKRMTIEAKKGVERFSSYTDTFSSHIP